MSKQKVALLLQHTADQAAPGDEIHLWPAVQARLETSTRPSLRGSTMNTRLILPNRLRTAALITIMLLLTAGLLLATPQGRAWAQSILRFFDRQESDLGPLPQGTPTDIQPILLVNQATQTAAPRPTANPPGCDILADAHCTIAEVQPKVSFPIKQLGILPRGMYLRGAVLVDQRVTLVYNCASGCFLLLEQEPRDGAAAPIPVGASAQVQNVQIQTSAGPVQGETVQGMYTGEGDGPVTWDATFTNSWLRWEEAGIRYTIQWLVPPGRADALKPDADLLVALAESLTGDAPQALNPSHLTSAADASLAAGFTVSVPSYTPRGYSPAYFSYEAETGFVCLSFAIDGALDAANHPRLFVRQRVSSPLSDLQPADPAGSGFSRETVPLGGAEGGVGRYTRGAFVPPASACGGVTEFTYSNEALQWRSEGTSFEIYGSVDQLGHHSVTQMDLVKMAESITGVVTIPPGQLDPGHLWSLAEMELFTGARILAPAVLPESYAFSHGVISAEKMLQVYQSTTPAPADSMAGKPVVYLYQCPQSAEDSCTKDLTEIPEEAREMGQIHGAPGIFARGSLMETQLTNGKKEWVTEDGFWHTRRLFWQSGGTSYYMLVLWGEGLDKDQMTAIANSIR